MSYSDVDGKRPVAAAATLPNQAAAAASESLQQAMGIRAPPPMMGAGNISTPPRSPTKGYFSGQHTHSHTGSSSPSPQRVVAQVPSTIVEQPLVEEQTATSVAAAMRRADVESIHIYADSNVYALFADVENQITKMSSAADAAAVASAMAGSPSAPSTPLSEDEQKQLHPGLLAWADLPPSIRLRNYDPLRALPAILADAGFQIVHT